MRKEESLKVVKFEFAKLNSVGNRLGLDVRFAQNATFVEDMEIYVELLGEAIKEIVQELKRHRDQPIVPDRAN